MKVTTSAAAVSVQHRPAAAAEALEDEHTFECSKLVIRYTRYGLDGATTNVKQFILLAQPMAEHRQLFVVSQFRSIRCSRDTVVSWRCCTNITAIGLTAR